MKKGDIGEKSEAVERLTDELEGREGTSETKEKELSEDDVKAANHELVQEYVPLFEEKGFEGGAFSIDGLLEDKDKILSRFKDEGQRKEMELLIGRMYRYGIFLDMFARIREEYEDSGKEIPQELLKGLMTMIEGMKKEARDLAQQSDVKETTEARKEAQTAYEKE